MAHSLRRPLLAAAVLAALAAPAWAQEKDTPGELAQEAMSKMVRALELMIQSIPQYEKPEINENGDIIIRRKHGDDEHDGRDEQRDYDREANALTGRRLPARWWLRRQETPPRALLFFESLHGPVRNCPR